MIRTVNEEITKSNLKSIRDLIQSCIGPNGRFKVLQTKDGGFAMTTTSSTKLFDFIEAKDPISQVLLAGFASHQQLFKNCGLFLAAFTCNLFLGHLESKLPRNVSIELNNYVHEMLMKKIETEEMTRELDIGKVKEMLVLVQSILRSKPLCQLTEEELEHLSIIILKAFFMNSDAKKLVKCGLVMLPIEGPQVMQSHLISGVALQITSVDSLNNKILAKCQGVTKMAVVTTSLAGDQTVIDESLLPQSIDAFPIDDVTYGAIWRLVDSFASGGVKIICCQKVVHPSVKKHLEDKGILVLERLGYQSVQYLCSATKVQPIESIFDDIAEANLTNIGKIEMYDFFGKRFLILQPRAENELYTMILCNSDESTLDELKSVIESVERSLYHVMKDPRVLCGGGCFEAQIATFVRYLTRDYVSIEDKFKYKSLAELSEANWLNGVDTIAKSFERIAISLHKQIGDCYVDNVHNHLWLFPRNTEPAYVTGVDFTCCCGSVDYVTDLVFESVVFGRTITGSCAAAKRTSKEAGIPRVSYAKIVDSFHLKSETISSAFELCNAALRIGVSLESQS